MSDTPYFIEVRMMGGVKQYLRHITNEIADRFGVEGATRTRPVPHITLFGPYDTSRGYEAKGIVRDVCGQFDIVPFRLNGFDHFGNGVIYVEVEASPALRELRRKLSRRLRPISTEYQPFDRSKYYRFHITVAIGDIAPQFNEIWSYVTDEYSPRGEHYALRVTSLRERQIMHEYDLLQNRLLSREEALSEASWERTKHLLEDNRSSMDHESCRSLSVLQRVRQQIETKLPD